MIFKHVTVVAPAGALSLKGDDSCTHRLAISTSIVTACIKAGNDRCRILIKSNKNETLFLK